MGAATATSPGADSLSPFRRPEAKVARGLRPRSAGRVLLSSYLVESKDRTDFLEVGSQRAAAVPSGWDLGIALAALAVTGCGGRSRPNVVLIVLDTTRADFLSSYGFPGPTTPSIDALGEEGVRYTRAFSTCYWTLPSHATLFTGLVSETGRGDLRDQSAPSRAGDPRRASRSRRLPHRRCDVESVDHGRARVSARASRSSRRSGGAPEPRTFSRVSRRRPWRGSRSSPGRNSRSSSS